MFPKLLLASFFSIRGNITDWSLRDELENSNASGYSIPNLLTLEFPELQTAASMSV